MAAHPEVEVLPGVSVLHGTDALDRLGAAFDDLLEGVGAPVTASRRWLDACVRARSSDTLIVTVEDDGGLAAVAPLAIMRRRGVSRVTMIGHGVSDRSCLAARDSAAAERLAEGIVAAAATWRRPWRLHLEQLPLLDPVARGVVDRLRHAQLVDGDACPVLSLDQDRNPATYLRRGLRRNLRSARNRLERDGFGWSVRRFDDPAQVEASFDDVLGLRRARDHELGRTSGVEESLWRQLVSEHAGAGQVEVIVLCIDDRLGGYAIVLFDRFTYRWWDSRIDSRFARYSPGHLLAEAALQGALARASITEIDMGRGTQADKRLLAPDDEIRSDVIATSSAWSRLALEAPGAARRRAAEFKNRHPAFRRAWARFKRLNTWRRASPGPDE